jgi:hypothetical protein
MIVNNKYINVLEKYLKMETNLEERKKMENELSKLKNKNILNSIKQNCEKTFCNNGCKNTLFENRKKI